MQLDDPRSTDEQVWNWKANRAEGQARFAEKEGLASTYPSRVRRRGGTYRRATDFTPEQFLTDAYQLYNGFHYWVWVPGELGGGGGAWRQNPNLPRNYGGQAIQIYNDVMTGNPPDGW